ncbi:MAG TPA: hypothetical protein VK912_19175 [Longimicrobiales bacterium]|nr:hypothetical protein [Longimicrobiales bacterium]
MTRNRLRSAAAVVFSSTALAACEQPTAPAVEKLDATLASVAGVTSCAGTPIGANNGKTFTVNVTLSDGSPGKSVLVTLVNPTSGPACEVEADANGVATFQGVAMGAQFVAMVRDEVNLYASQLQIAPPHPGGNLVNQVADAPSLAVHQRPTLLRGGACTGSDALTWSGYMGALADPCIMPNGNGYAVSIQLTQTTGTSGKLIGLPGNSSDVIVAALNTWTAGPQASQAAACAALPWIQGSRLADCSDPMLSDGPAVLQAMGRADHNGNFKVGAFGSPLVIETVLGGTGFTFFGTATESTGGQYIVHVVPGMCRVDDSTTVEDETNPSGASPLDILRTFSTIGLTTALSDPTDPLSPMILAPVPSTAIVGAIIKSNGGGKGELAVQYRLNSGNGMYSVKATFSITSAGVCTIDPASGSGLGLIDGSTVGHVGTCAESVSTAGEFKLAFVLTGLPASVDRESMVYTLKAAKDNIDAARFALQRGSIPYAGQYDTSCPLPTNNDGRYDLGM